jgi:uncharacterized protein YkwD
MGDFVRLGVIVFSLALFVGCGGGGSSSSTTTDNNYAVASNIESPDPSNAPILSKETIDEYMKAINDARTKEGGQDCGKHGHFDPAPPLKWNDQLYRSAYEHSYDMAKSDTFSHDGSGTEYDWTAQVQDLGRGSKLQDRVENNNYKNWKKIGENIAAGTDFKSAKDAVEAWIESDDHCENLMNPDFTEVGMSVVYDEDSYYHYYWTQDFGKR